MVMMMVMVRMIIDHSDNVDCWWWWCWSWLSQLVQSYVKSNTISEIVLLISRTTFWKHLCIWNKKTPKLWDSQTIRLSGSKRPTHRDSHWDSEIMILLILEYPLCFWYCFMTIMTKWHLGETGSADFWANIDISDCLGLTHQHCTAAQNALQCITQNITEFHCIVLPRISFSKLVSTLLRHNI